MLSSNASALGLLAIAVYATAQTVPQVTLRNTVITGTQVSPLVEFFGGIPFAQPPVGNLSFKPAVLQLRPSRPGSENAFNATTFGSACLQNPLFPAPLSPDCLNLNIFRPATLSSSEKQDKVPVMVWIHGGAFILGASFMYDGTNLTVASMARGTPTIFVSINYRLGPLGFAQGAEAEEAGALNLGLKDQLVALEWVKANIGAFGGDAGKVTVFGESAGASSVDIHLLTPPITRLARAAIIESTIRASFPPPRTNEPSFLAFVASVPGCESASTTPGQAIPCLRDSTTANLLEGMRTVTQGGKLSFVPVIDGAGGIIPTRATEIVPAARFPIMIGSNLDEGTLFVDQQTDSDSDIRQFLTVSLSGPDKNPEDVAEAIDKILDLYPDIPALGSPIGTGNETFGLNSQYKRVAAIQNDLVFHSRRRQVTLQRAGLGLKMFAYHFTDRDAQFTLGAIPAAPGSLGVAHSTEIAYVYNTIINRTPNAEALTAAMQDYWLSFASSLTPNDGIGTSRVNWPQYTAANKVLIQLDGANTTVIPDTYREERINFFLTDPTVAA